MKKTILVAAACALALPLATTEASAQKKAEVEAKITAKSNDEKAPTVTTTPGDTAAPATAERDYVQNPSGVSFGAMLGTGFADAYGVGIGGRGGYTFQNRVYVGGTANYHFGSSMEALGIKTNSGVWHLGPEVGYDVGIGAVILRPVAGLGVAFKTDKVTANGVTDSNTAIRPYFAPGASVIYPIKNYFIGGDSRVMVMGGGQATAITLFGTAGMHL